MTLNNYIEAYGLGCCIALVLFVVIKIVGHFL